MTARSAPQVVSSRIRERQTAASTASMPNTRPRRRGQAPNPYRGAPRAQGLTAAIAVAGPSPVPSIAPDDPVSLNSTGADVPMAFATLRIYTSLTDTTSQCPTNCRRWASGDPDELGSRMPSDKLLSQQSPRARSSWHQGPMSADARLQERPISNTILPRPRRTPDLLCSRSHMCQHVPAVTRRFHYMRRTAHRARYSGSCLNGRLCRPRMSFRAGSKADKTN
jgi:hypothetical protein